MSIAKDFKRGHNGVLKFISSVTNVLAAFKINEFKEAPYDVICCINDKIFTVEVKADYKSLVTKNIAIEYYNPRSNKKSGLAITKADFWCIVRGHDIFLIKTDTLRNYIENNQPNSIKDNVGDGNANIYLYKCVDILPQFIHINQINTEEVKDYILTSLES